MNIPDSMPILSSGSHNDPRDGACVMEYISLLSGDVWTDTPDCTNPILARLAQGANDHLPDLDRNVLMLPLIPRLMGTSRSTEINLGLAQTMWDFTRPICRLCHYGMKICEDHATALGYIEHGGAWDAESAVGHLSNALGFDQGVTRYKALLAALDYYDTHHRTVVVEPTVEDLVKVNTILFEALR